MKKVISLLLVLTLVFGLSITAMAEEINTGDNTIDVGATYTGGIVQIVGPDGTVTTATVYSVKLAWTAIENITYNAGTESYYWDAAKLEYVKHTDTSVDAGWEDSESSCTITVTNSSNAAVTATASFAAAENIGATVTCTFENNGMTVASAAPSQAELESGITAGSAKTGAITAKVSATGALNSGVTSVGTITITIAG